MPLPGWSGEYPGEGDHTDSDGARDSDNQLVYVEVANVAPTVELSGPATANEGDTKSYTYTVTDPGDDPSPTITESCGTNATYVDTPALGSFACTFPKGPANSTVSVSANDGDHTGTGSVVVSVSNVAPTISDITDQTTNEGSATPDIPSTIGDAGTPADDLTVSGSSSNTTLVPNANTVFDGTGANRTVTITPAAGQTGTATITVRVSDGTDAANDTFVLTVRAVDTVAPTVIKVAPTGKKVSPRANVVASFSEAMMRRSLNGVTVKLVKKGTTKKIAATLSYPAPNKVVLNPKRNLVRGAVYTATVLGGASGVKDLAGNALAVNKVWTFRIR